VDEKNGQDCDTAKAIESGKMRPVQSRLGDEGGAAIDVILEPLKDLFECESNQTKKTYCGICQTRHSPPDVIPGTRLVPRD
jgi:hypothetical protein